VIVFDDYTFCQIFYFMPWRGSQLATGLPLVFYLSARSACHCADAAVTSSLLYPNCKVECDEWRRQVITVLAVV